MRLLTLMPFLMAIQDRIISEISLGFPAFSGSCSEIYLEKCFLNTSFQPLIVCLAVNVEKQV